ncbi:LysR family transcriptional regulator [Kordiimonas sp. SCSIO 12603]|uniref:LysR family transcriptional regulator n=1 Tax=Kordiimonas sp. SCSIO 12603 TaxID=2829596 RepID=UPI0021065C95|nr:LysR family transcriptional regulator [Kordiimonas sp. SCSIO 12603]UTW58759.1 LysR family transcriptional regulator [Kordiimonas sp. SCSIO 12603]
MDIVQARTFLAVLETGSFLRAAEKINAAQSTISGRIKTLEVMLGQELFERNKTGATPTQAGKEFARHAISIVRMWDQAKISLALRDEQKSMLTIGGQPSLWDGFLLKWLPWMRQHAPEIAIRAQMVASSPALMQQLVDGVLDLVVLYRPEARPGYVIRQIFEEHLVLVTSELSTATIEENRYIYFDWGPEFQADHAMNFPELSTPVMNLNVGTLGISFLLENKATGYFPLRIAEPFLQSGELKLLEDTPIFTYPTYAAYSEDHDSKLIEVAIDGLKRVASKELPEPEDVF